MRGHRGGLGHAWDQGHAICVNTEVGSISVCRPRKPRARLNPLCLYINPKPPSLGISREYARRGALRGAVCGSLCFFYALERVLNAFLCLILWEGSRRKGVAVQQVLVCQVTLVCQLLFGVLSGVVSCVFRVLVWWALFFVAFVMLSMVHVTWEEFPVVWTSMVDFYNSNVGPWVGDMIVVPLSILNLILRAVLPLWNSVMWIGQGLVVHGVLPVVVENIGVLLSMALEVVNLCEHFAQSATVFMWPFLVCTDVACLLPEARGLNLLTPMGDLRQIVGHACRSRGTCARRLPCRWTCWSTR